MNLRRIAYYSTASHSLTDSQLANLREVCRSNNNRLHISGYLHYHQGTFLQVLEGPEQSVADIFCRICNDPHHHSFRILLDEAIPRRTFANWSMGRSCNQNLPEVFCRRIQAGFDKLRDLDHVLATQVLLLCDQLMQANVSEEAA